MQYLWYFSSVGLTQLCEGSVSDPEHPQPFHYQPSPQPFQFISILTSNTAVIAGLGFPLTLRRLPSALNCAELCSKFCFVFYDVDECPLEIGNRNSCLLETAQFKNSTSVKAFSRPDGSSRCFVRFIHWPFQVQNREGGSRRGRKGEISSEAVNFTGSKIDKQWYVSLKWTCLVQWGSKTAELNQQRATWFKAAIHPTAPLKNGRWQFILPVTVCRSRSLLLPSIALLRWSVSSETPLLCIPLSWTGQSEDQRWKKPPLAQPYPLLFLPSYFQKAFASQIPIAQESPIPPIGFTSLLWVNICCKHVCLLPSAPRCAQSNPHDKRATQARCSEMLNLLHTTRQDNISGDRVLWDAQDPGSLHSLSMHTVEADEAKKIIEMTGREISAPELCL